MAEYLSRQELACLQDWYNSDNRKPMIIRGARQVGKSTLVRQFAEKQGLRLVELNFERNPEYRQAFETNDPAQILSMLQLLTNHDLVGHGYLLFLDEIQVAPEAIAALRYFFEEKPELAVLAAGSLLEFTLKDTSFSMPVGRIQYMHMGPMQFADFLYALGEKALVGYLSDFNMQSIHKPDFTSVLHEKCMRLYRQFCVIGGMPEAIAQYAKNRAYTEVAKVHSSILTTYRDDFNKYSHGARAVRVQLVFDRAAALVGKKFKYVQVSKDHRAAELRDALDQLCLARVFSRVHHSSANGVPLGAEKKAALFKVLFMDVGLLSSVLNINELNLKEDGPNLVNRGAVAEQFVGQHLLYSEKAYQALSLFYWVREAKNAAAEVDYLQSIGQQVVPVEIKSGATGTLRSLHQFCFEKQSSLAIRFNSEPASFLDKVHASTGEGKAHYSLLSLPLYMVGQAKGLASEVLERI